MFSPKKKKKKKKLPGEKYFSPTGLILRDRPGPVTCDRYWVGGWVGWGMGMAEVPASE